MAALKHLFAPIRLGSMEVKNRLVMPPMSINFGVDEDGFVTEQHWEYLAARARAGTGMIVVGGGAVDPGGLDLPKMPPIWDDKYIPALRLLAQAVKVHGARIGMQLLHGGRQAFHGDKVAPSPLPALGVVKGVPRELTAAEIKALVGAHGQAARRCRDSGFDFVEIHAAHGYLISEFLAPLSNLRKDRYGGEFENRIRFLLEILAEIKARCGEEYPVGVRYNGDDCLQGGWTLPEAVALAPLLESAGADWLHVSAGIYGSFPVTIPSMYQEHGCFVHLAEAVKKAVSIPVIAVGRIKDPKMADSIIAQGQADLVAMGRAHLADPDLAEKARSGRLEDIRPCLGCCRGCIDTVLNLGEATCVMNPELGREYLLKNRPKPARSKKILVVGAGPAGLAAARRLGLEGHSVTVVEEGDAVGGLANLAARAPGRAELLDLVRYHERELGKLGVDIRLRTRLDNELIEALKPEAAILATGALPRIPEIPGLLDTDMNVSTVLEAFSGEAQLGQKIIVLGGGAAGLTLADFLAEGAREVAVLNRDGRFAPELAANDRTYLRERLKRPGIRLFKNVAIEAFLPDGVTFTSSGQRRELAGFSDFVIAESLRPMRQAGDLLRARGVEVVPIGDAKEPRGLLETQAEGDEAGRGI